MATTTSTVTTAPTAPSTTAATAPAHDPIRVERGHRAAWVAAGVAVVVLSTAGIVAARTASTSEVPPATGAAVARADAAESAHGHGSSIRTGAGPVAVAAPVVASVPGPVTHRTPPLGMEDDATATATRRSDRPRNVQPGQPSGS